MKELKELSKYLKRKITGKTLYAIPSHWVISNYSGKLSMKDGRYFVDPYEYYAAVIDSILENDNGLDYSKSLAQINGEKDASWIRKAKMYGALPRATVAYNHKGFGAFEPEDIFGYKESGTFLKMIGLLPYLKELGINVLYMLPISKMSDVFKKGEIGSPYAVKNPIELDESYADPLLEGIKLEEQFKALVQAAHMLGIRVVLDFIPRTAARDSDLIKTHPDWFYWIKIEEVANYKPPHIPELPFKIPDPEDLEIIYSSEEVKEHLKKFTLSPDKLDSEKWEKVKKMEGDILSNIAKEFGIITPPGFSDWVNDPQPTWDDVTFFRLYLDHPEASQKYVSKDQPPYVLFDVIKSSKFPGKKPNKRLWEYIANIVPTYQKKFGIDGARIDMGHALPSELQDMIISAAKEIDPAFGFIAEELEMKNDKKAKSEGYDCILGNSWYASARPSEFYRFVEEIVPNLEVPYIASCETPDTPRVVARENGNKLKYLAPALLYLSPNSIPYINSGQEIEEIQPMNLGLDNTIYGKTVLPPDDQFYGKLAFFDYYAMHWDKASKDMYNYLKWLLSLREEIEKVMDGEFRYVYLNYQDGTTANYSYWKGDIGAIVLGNLNLVHEKYVEVFLKETVGRDIKAKDVKLITRFGKRKLGFDLGNTIPVNLQPGEFAVILVNWKD
ncbi:MAG: alpha-amylase family glycosyl hydrolase [Fervidobacterium sp.]|uniref:alpha-amylase family glycosyl hydrolase n=1 Tax=Fervidobacterium sp. TaxID=1871331 RepID=UPI004049E76E